MSHQNTVRDMQIIKVRNIQEFVTLNICFFFLIPVLVPEADGFFHKGSPIGFQSWINRALRLKNHTGCQISGNVFYWCFSAFGPSLENTAKHRPPCQKVLNHIPAIPVFVKSVNVYIFMVYIFISCKWVSEWLFLGCERIWHLNLYFLYFTPLMCKMYILLKKWWVKIF